VLAEFDKYTGKHGVNIVPLKPGVAQIRTINGITFPPVVGKHQVNIDTD